MIGTICVCGAGTMGGGIAQAVAQSGFRTILYDLNGEGLQKARHSIERSLQSLVEKNRINTGEQQAILARLTFTDAIEDCKGDFVIEAIIEQPQAKRDLFDRLSALNPPDTILASNTSSLSVTAIADGTDHPERVIGMHFFNPAPVMKLVEIIHTGYTDERTARITAEIAAAMGKTAVVCKDSPGFIVNHVARPYYLEALRLAEGGLTDFETIDILMEASGFRMGPFRLMDLIGNDVNYAVSCSVYKALGEPMRLKPSSLQEQKVQKGELGRKTGKGYYDYGG
jgi:3-hydroxybutyryl-CoA dehydrogenase